MHRWAALVIKLRRPAMTLEPEIAIERQDEIAKAFGEMPISRSLKNNSIFRNDRFGRLELDSLEAELLAEQRALELAEIVERTLRRFHGDPNLSIQHFGRAKKVGHGDGLRQTATDSRGSYRREDRTRRRAS
jgi:Rps23 Pro-64 3,4-dihydroxylase Tpa1-like proline 4-hydroxylase